MATRSRLRISGRKIADARMRIANVEVVTRAAVCGQRICLFPKCSQCPIDWDVDFTSQQFDLRVAGPPHAVALGDDGASYCGTARWWTMTIRKPVTNRRNSLATLLAVDVFRVGPRDLPTASRWNPHNDHVSDLLCRIHRS